MVSDFKSHAVNIYKTKMVLGADPSFNKIPLDALIQIYLNSDFGRSDPDLKSSLWQSIMNGISNHWTKKVENETTTEKLKGEDGQILLTDKGYPKIKKNTKKIKHLRMVLDKTNPKVLQAQIFIEKFCRFENMGNKNTPVYLQNDIAFMTQPEDVKSKIIEISPIYGMGDVSLFKSLVKVPEGLRLLNTALPELSRMGFNVGLNAKGIESLNNNV